MNQPDLDAAMFGGPDCTCVPFTRQTNPPRYLNRPTDTVDMISGWERGRDCPHHAPAAQAPADRAALRDRIAEALLDHLSRTADIRPDRNGDLAFMPEVTDAERLRIADAVLAVLPEPADRAVVLREFLSQLDERLLGCCEECNACAAIARDLAAEMKAEDPELRRLAGAQPVPDEAPVVAYRNPDWPGMLLCREHGDGWVGRTPLTSEDLPDGGICTWGGCGVDVLIPQPPTT